MRQPQVMIMGRFSIYLGHEAFLSFPDRSPDENDACWQGYARLRLQGLGSDDAAGEFASPRNLPEDFADQRCPHRAESRWDFLMEHNFQWQALRTKATLTDNMECGAAQASRSAYAPSTPSLCPSSASYAYYPSCLRCLALLVLVVLGSSSSKWFGVRGPR
jgi:hypothetical protein